MDFGSDLEVRFGAGEVKFGAVKGLARIRLRRLGAVGFLVTQCARAYRFRGIREFSMGLTLEKKNRYSYSLSAFNDFRK